MLIPLLAGTLVLMGLLTLQSIAPKLASNQLVFALLAAVVFWLTSRLNWPKIQQYRWLAYLGLCALLIFTLIIGRATRGSTRWISVGGLFSVQGSQLAIPIVGLVLANQIAKQKVTYSSLFQWLMIIGIPGILILIAPDLGTTLVYLGSVGTGLVLAPIPAKYWWQLLGLGLVAGVLTWTSLLAPYQKQRIFSFVAPDIHEAASYNAAQALIAVGSGQWWGRGLGQGIQSHLKFLPEYQTDFIFASLAEEWGFMGSFLIWLTYLVLVRRLWQISAQTNQKTASYWVGMIATMIAMQASIHIGMNMGLLPVTGITLPLVSYGGSSMLSIAGALGICQAIIRQSSRHKALVIR